jgi:ABC-2 type transport system ATP-binding protein
MVADRTVVEVETFGVEEHTLELLRATPGVETVSVETRDHAQLVRVQSARGVELTPLVLGQLDGARIGRVDAHEPTLEDAYVALVEDR